AAAGGGGGGGPGSAVRARRGRRPRRRARRRRIERADHGRRYSILKLQIADCRLIGRLSIESRNRTINLQSTICNRQFHCCVFLTSRPYLSSSLTTSSSSGVETSKMSLSSIAVMR